jgi:hypothetical protein
LTHEQQAHDVQTLCEERRPTDDLSADQQIAKKLHPQHPVAKEVVAGGDVLFSALIYPYR